jgi:hypothetical protein
MRPRSKFTSGEHGFCEVLSVTEARHCGFFGALAVEAGAFQLRDQIVEMVVQFG